jgi:phage tail sheath protein FI
MSQYKTPGVYIVEKNAFPNSVVEAATAVPAFIGYTEKADNKGKSLANKPWRIASLSEYHSYFGFGPSPKFSLAEKDSKSTEEASFSLAGKEYVLKQEKGNYALYRSMVLFYQNGGGPCYVVSVGSTVPDKDGNEQDIDPDKLKAGIETLMKEQEPTMVVVPDAVLLNNMEDCIGVQQAALSHCGGRMKNRFAILDLFDGYKDRHDPDGDCVATFRDKLGINYLDYAAAYYPWINTTIVQDRDLSYENISNPDALQDLLRTELKLPATADKDTPPKDAQRVDAINNIVKDWASDKDIEPGEIYLHKALLNKTLCAISPLFNNVLLSIKNHLNLLPPSAALAGVYTMVDNSRGVWKAPANASLNSVVSPAVNITHEDQEDLNVTAQGKSINAIRTFIGEGTLVWGARTLDGNSLDWRYINVRRTMIMLEESIRLASKAYVFEPNVANTWVTIKSMIRNFLTGIWKRGGLAGASPDDAFAVFVGLGETMTPEDILEGILRVTVLVAISHPAEFIEITFQQQMQKS